MCSISDLWFLTIAVELSPTDGMTDLVRPDCRSAPVAASDSSATKRDLNATRRRIASTAWKGIVVVRNVVS
jgi:hypothetical protein